ncbi:hypothetical protein [Mycoplasma bradburyae]|uniref:Uncharacterized protein n=1 Tax=Mycoplasma bradburyae TaxID=2963128 RepID=A0ABT5GBJ1_9MOLU|nr:hypothetical protein [Mycoplasma bradburyae]MDC4182198.1 hypothetical protein [Mycoplasma bradburyae]UTS70024.1 hypothetical protein NMG68_03295 [Mycoplasma bradburyae]
MNTKFKTITISKTNLAIFLTFIATGFIVGATLFSLMLQSFKYENVYIGLDKEKALISLILPVVFFFIFSVVSAGFLIKSKERYEFNENIKNNKKKQMFYLLLIELLQLLIWIGTILLLIFVFFPIGENNKLFVSYKEFFGTSQGKIVDFDDIYALNASNNNSIAALKISIIQFASLASYHFNQASLAWWTFVYLILYLSIFLAYVKTGLFNKRYLTLIPFTGLFNHLKEPSNSVKTQIVYSENLNNI